MNYFQYRCYGTHQNLKDQGRHFYSLFVAEHIRKPQSGSKREKDLERAFIVAISGMYLGGGYRHDGEPIRITLNKNRYEGSTRLSPVYTNELYTAFRWLIEKAYIEQVEPERFVDGKWIPRGYRLTRKWLDIAVHFPPEFEILRSIARNPVAPFVELRRDGVSVKLPASKEKDLTIQRLDQYEKRLANHIFTIAGQTIPPFAFSLTRIYTGNYKRGGRYYSLFQQKSSQYRLNMMIDGEPVAEVDYKSLHPSLLYQREGLEAPEDPYDTGGDFPRSMVKKAFQVLVNRSKPAPATNSLRYWLNESRRLGKPDPKDWQNVGSITNTLCERLESTLRERLKPIAHYFCTGYGLLLQHHDSQLVSHVIDYFFAKTTSVVIPIHDSFVVKQSDLKHLGQAIRYAEVIESKVLGLPFREPLLEVEVMNQGFGYDKELMDLSIPLKASSIHEESLKKDLELEFNREHQDDENQYCFDAQIEDQ